MFEVIGESAIMMGQSETISEAKAFARVYSKGTVDRPSCQVSIVNEDGDVIYIFVGGVEFCRSDYR